MEEKDCAEDRAVHVALRMQVRAWRMHTHLCMQVRRMGVRPAQTGWLKLAWPAQLM